MKVDHPRVTGPLDFRGLGSGIGLFSGLLFLVIHVDNSNFYLYPKFLTTLLESWWGSRHFTCSVRRFLPYIFSTLSSLNRQASNTYFSFL